MYQEALRVMEPLHQEALRIKKSVLGEEPVGCADSLDGLARLPPTTLFGRGRQADDIVRDALTSLFGRRR